MNPNQQQASGNPVPFITAPTAPSSRVFTAPLARGSGSTVQEPAGAMKATQTNQQVNKYFYFFLHALEK